MFKSKYTISFLNCKWTPLKRNLKITVIPRIDEFIYLEGKYYRVINVVHMMNKNQDIFIIIDEFSQVQLNVTG